MALKVLEVELIVLMSAFVMVNPVWSVSCSLFFYSRCALCPAICKSGGARAPVPNGVGTTDCGAVFVSHTELAYSIELSFTSESS